jgi:hypothetical protein
LTARTGITCNIKTLAQYASNSKENNNHRDAINNRDTNNSKDAKANDSRDTRNARSRQFCGSGMFIPVPDPIFSILDHKYSGTRIRIRIKEFKYS